MDDLTSLLEVFLVTYNREKYLSATLERIFCAESPIRNLRITILDNSSTDGSFELIDEYARRYPNISHVINNRNIGGNANICKCYELASYPYFWILCDDDEYDWTHWGEVERAIRNGTDAIVVSNYANPGLNVAQLLCQLTFVPAAIYKKENISDTIMVNAEYQISTMFPQLALVCKLVNDQKKIAIMDHWVVNMVLHDEDSSYTRGLDVDRNPLMASTTWSLGFLKSIQMINDAKTREYVIRHLRMARDEPILHPEFFFKYNKTIGNNNYFNIYEYYALLPIYRVRFLALFAKHALTDGLQQTKEWFKKTRIGGVLLWIKRCGRG